MVMQVTVPFAFYTLKSKSIKLKLQANFNN